MNDGHSPGHARFWITIGAFALLVAFALGAGSWATDPLAAQQATVPTRTPIGGETQPQPTEPSTSGPTTTLTPTELPADAATLTPTGQATESAAGTEAEVAPVVSLPVVGIWVEP